MISMYFIFEISKKSLIVILEAMRIELTAFENVKAMLENEM